MRTISLLQLIVYSKCTIIVIIIVMYVSASLLQVVVFIPTEHIGGNLSPWTFVLCEIFQFIINACSAKMYLAVCS